MRRPISLLKRSSGLVDMTCASASRPEVARLLDSCDRSSMGGMRELAILMLLVLLGVSRRGRW
jgi:hypothetical protein